MPEAAVSIAGHFSIQEAARLTGIGISTLRAWEMRFDFPQPKRGPGGHRLYSSADIEALRQVQADRAAGLQLPVAIERARVAEHGSRGSVLAALRRANPELIPQTMAKPAVVRLSRAIEDECLQRADRPVLLGAFQHERYYFRSRRRWTELARAARLAVVCAEPETRRARNAKVAVAGPGFDVVPLAVDDGLRREWVVAALAPDFAACLVGWEAPTVQEPASESARKFEVAWSAEPDAVSGAMRHIANAIAATDADVARRLGKELDRIPVGPASLAVVTALTNRMVAYLT